MTKAWNNWIPWINSSLSLPHSHRIHWKVGNNFTDFAITLNQVDLKMLKRRQHVIDWLCVECDLTVSSCALIFGFNWFFDKAVVVVLTGFFLIQKKWIKDLYVHVCADLWFTCASQIFYWFVGRFWWCLLLNSMENTKIIPNFLARKKSILTSFWQFNSYFFG